MNKRNRYILISLFLAMLSIIFAVIILASIPSAKGYEISIYSVYPWYFWCAIIVATLIGLYAMIHYAFENEKINIWKIAFMVIMLANFIVISLPVFRNYFLTDLADVVNHYGQVNAITMTAHISPTDYYPITHILSYQMASILNTDNRYILNNIAPLIYYLIYILGIYILSKYVCKNNKGRVILIMTLSSVLLYTYFNYLFLPTQLFLFYIPIILFVFFNKGASFNYTVMFMIMIIYVPYAHPLGAIFLIIILLLYEFSVMLNNYLLAKANIGDGILKSGASVNALLIVFIMWFLWFSLFQFWNMLVMKAYSGLVLGAEETTLSNLSGTVQTAKFNIYDFTFLLFKNYGHDIIYSLMAVISILVCLRMIKKRQHVNIYCIFFSIMFIAFALIYLATLVGNFSVTGYSIRIYCWALFASIVLNGYVFHDIISRLKGKIFIISKACVMISIMIASIVGIFSTYWSPIIENADMQVTRMDWATAVWYYGHKANYTTLVYDNLPKNSSEGIYGYGLAKPDTLGSFIHLPKHLGLDQENSLPNNTYITITKRMRDFKTMLFPDVGDFTVADLEALNNSDKVINVYTNNETDIYEILGTKAEEARKRTQ